jgi:hypothetical protein
MAMRSLEHVVELWGGETLHPESIVVNEGGWLVCRMGESEVLRFPSDRVKEVYSVEGVEDAAE